MNEMQSKFARVSIEPVRLTVSGMGSDHCAGIVIVSKTASRSPARRMP